MSNHVSASLRLSAAAMILLLVGCSEGDEAAEPSAAPETDLVWIGEVATNNWVHQNFSELERDDTFSFMTKLRKAIVNVLIINPDNFSAAEKLLVLRANPDHRDNLLVNRFLSEFVPFDFLTRFVVNKLAFYKDYETFNDAQRDYAVHIIKNRYFADKDDLWQRYYG